MTDWERNWRGNGIVFVVLTIVAGVIYGASSQPGVGASAEELVSFFDGDRTRILIATPVFCGAFLCLLWFGAALASALRDAGKGGWGNAAMISSAALGAMFFVLMTVRALLAYSIAGSGSPEVTSALADLAYALTVVLAFPAAMFVMSGAFGLWRAGIIGNRFFAAGVVVVVLVLLGGTTWARDGVSAPDGAYSVASSFILFAWIAVLSGFLMRRPATVSTADRVVVPAT